MRRKSEVEPAFGLLVGGDAFYQVLAELTKQPRSDFTIKSLARKIKRTIEHARVEIGKLIELDVVAEVGRDRKARVYAVTEAPLSKELLELPAVLVQQLGKYRRPRAADR